MSALTIARCRRRLRILGYTQVVSTVGRWGSEIVHATGPDGDVIGLGETVAEAYERCTASAENRRTAEVAS